MTPRFDAIGLVVADIATSLAFYGRLGLAVPDTEAGAPHAEVTLPNGMRLLFDTASSVPTFDPSWTPPTGGHRVALAFACDTPAEVDATHAALVAEGHRSHVDPWDAFWGQRYATVLDPDDNPVDLFAPLP